MNSNVSNIYPSKQTANYIRLGYNGHSQLENWLQCGRLKLERVVVDATQVVNQKELLSTLRSLGSDLVLDTRSAELVHNAAYVNSKTLNKLAWADSDRAFLFDDFNSDSIKNYVDKIASFAIEHRFNSIISPTHSIADIKDDWISLDIELSHALREALNRRGGEDITIEYPLITTANLINDIETRDTMINRLKDAEFNNLWLKISGLGGNNASAGGLKKYIESITKFQSLNKPIVADCIGGLASMAALAFGATGAISHGIAMQETFNLNSWTKVRDQDKKFGIKTRIYFSDIDLYLYKEQANILFEQKGVKPILLCKNDECCHAGKLDMYNNSNEHFLYQRLKQIDDLNKTPQFNRTHYFLEEMLRPTIRNAQKLVNLDVTDTKLNKKLLIHKNRLERIYRELDNLNEISGLSRNVLIPNRCRLNSMLMQQGGKT